MSRAARFELRLRSLMPSGKSWCANHVLRAVSHLLDEELPAPPDPRCPLCLDSGMRLIIYDLPLNPSVPATTEWVRCGCKEKS